MDKHTSFESVMPGSGQYALKRDLRLNAWLLVATVVYLTQAFLIRRHLDWSPALKVTVALTPLLPALLYIRDWVRFVGRLDDLQRQVQMRAHLIAAWGAILVGVVVAILNEHGAWRGLPYGLGLGGVMLVVFPLWLAGYALANCRFK